MVFRRGLSDVESVKYASLFPLVNSIFICRVDLDARIWNRNPCRDFSTKYFSQALIPIQLCSPPLVSLAWPLSYRSGDPCWQQLQQIYFSNFIISMTMLIGLLEVSISNTAYLYLMCMRPGYHSDI